MATWGLVLSAGTAYGIANAGVLSALEEAKLRPDCVAGSSMGAIVAALYATGHTSETMLEIIQKLSLTSIARLADRPLSRGLFGGILRQRIQEFLDPYLGTKTIADCEIPFVCLAGRVINPIDWSHIRRRGFMDDLKKSVEPYVFPPSTRLVDACIASSAIPVIFAPGNIGNDEFIDLLNFGAIPSRTLRSVIGPQFIVATDTTADRSALARFLPAGAREFFEESSRSLRESLDACDLVIRPNLPKGQMWRFDRALEFFRLGKEAGQENIANIRSLLSITPSRDRSSR